MLRIGLIGFGRWGTNLARNVEAAGASLAAVCDLRGESLRLAGASYPGAALFARWQDLLRYRAVEAVIIATPARTHFEIALASLLAGRHALVEKPMTTATGDARRLIDAAAARGLRLMVDHTFLYAEGIREIRRNLHAGRLGRPRRYEGLRQGPRPANSDIDVLWDLASHDIAIMDHLFETPAQSVNATAVGQARAAAELEFDFGDALLGQVHVAWDCPIKVRRSTVSGSRGRISYDGGLELDGEAQPLRDGVETLTVVLREFGDCIANSRQPLSDGAAGLRVVQVLEAATASLRLGRAVRL